MHLESALLAPCRAAHSYLPPTARADRPGEFAFQASRGPQAECLPLIDRAPLALELRIHQAHIQKPGTCFRILLAVKRYARGPNCLNRLMVWWPQTAVGNSLVMGVAPAQQRKLSRCGNYRSAGPLKGCDQRSLLAFAGRYKPLKNSEFCWPAAARVATYLPETRVPPAGRSNNCCYPLYQRFLSTVFRGTTWRMLFDGFNPACDTLSSGTLKNSRPRCVRRTTINLYRTIELCPWSGVGEQLRQAGSIHPHVFQAGLTDKNIVAQLDQKPTHWPDGGC